MGKVFFSCQKSIHLTSVSTNSKSYGFEYLELEEPTEQLWSITVNCPKCNRIVVFKKTALYSVVVISGLDTLCRTLVSEYSGKATIGAPMVYIHTLYKERSKSEKFAASMWGLREFEEKTKVLVKEQISNCRKHGEYISDNSRCPACVKKVDKDAISELEPNYTGLKESERVRKVLFASGGLFQRLNNSIAAIFSEGNKLWFEEFSKQEGWGKTRYLDLGDADYSGSFFVSGGGTVDGFLKNANFKRAKLIQTEWLYIDLSNVNFSHSALSKSHFESCSANGTLFREADLREAYINLYSSSNPSDFSGADLRDATIILGAYLSPIISFALGPKYILKGAKMHGCKIKVLDSLGRKRKSGYLYDFLKVLSEEQQNQIILMDPSLKPAKPSGCFIATAVYGSPFYPDVCILRQFRDETLVQSKFGRWFIRNYELMSPPIANWLRDRPIIRYIIRGLIIYPLVTLVRFHSKYMMDHDELISDDGL